MHLINRSDAMSYEERAIEYCEKYGIVQYSVKGGQLLYYANYPAYLSNPRRSYKVVVDLKTMKETRTLLQRYNKQGDFNRYK